MAIHVKISDLGKTIKVLNEQWLQEFVLEVGTKVVDKTPVKTGLLKGSNAISIGSSQGSLGATDPSGAGVKAQMASVSKRINSGDDVYITNGADYAEEVERGSSQQAPNGFMMRTAIEAKAIAAKVAKGI